MDLIVQLTIWKERSTPSILENGPQLFNGLSLYNSSSQLSTKLIAKMIDLLERA